MELNQQSPIAMTRLDHLVLTVADVEATCAFYAAVLGMEVVTFGADQRKALRFGEQKINLHEKGAEIQPNAACADVGTADICLITRTPLAQVRTHLQAHEVPLVQDIVERTGALGPIRSVYIRDPDGNLIEIANEI